MPSSRILRRSFQRISQNATCLKSKEHAKRRCLSTHYYDSQSGLHIPVYNESEIRLFWDATKGFEGEDQPLIPLNLSKDRLEADELSETLREFAGNGIHGVILPPIRFPRDARNLETLAIIAPSNFTVALTQASNDRVSAAYFEKDAPTLSQVLSFGEESLVESLKEASERCLHTTLSIHEDSFAATEPIAIANRVAATIDAHGGCDSIWISSSTEDHADTMVQLCEELVYLDVAGATIKSRLLVDAWNEDMLEDVLFAGINKFVVRERSQVDLVVAAAEDQGKTVLVE